MNKEFKVIPGYEGYSVSNDGVILSNESGNFKPTYLLNGYRIADTFYGAKTETLPVHRAVALAWIENTNPDVWTVVNHKDGDRQNNDYTNLEWTDYSGNNYHAVNTGLRRDPISCYVRRFDTGDVFDFPSIASACSFMGMPKDTPYAMLKPKMFGKLIRDCFEFKYANETTPWFYEQRKERVKPSRYMLTAIDPDGIAIEVYSTKEILKAYQLYGAPYGKSIPGLAKHAQELYPEHRFIVRDSYTEDQYRERKKTKGSERILIQAIKDEEVMEFDSLTKCANYFGVDRSTIQSRLEFAKNLDGWVFNQLPDQSEKID